MMMLRECGVGLSLRGAYQDAFKIEADAEDSKRPRKDQVRLRQVAQMAFETLEKHEAGCLIYRGAGAT